MEIHTIQCQRQSSLLVSQHVVSSIEIRVHVKNETFLFCTAGEGLGRGAFLHMLTVQNGSKLFSTLIQVSDGRHLNSHFHHVRQLVLSFLSPLHVKSSPDRKLALEEFNPSGQSPLYV